MEFPACGAIRHRSGSSGRERNAEQLRGTFPREETRVWPSPLRGRALSSSRDSGPLSPADPVQDRVPGSEVLASSALGKRTRGPRGRLGLETSRRGACGTPSLRRSRFRARESFQRSGRGRYSPIPSPQSNRADWGCTGWRTCTCR